MKPKWSKMYGTQQKSSKKEFYNSKISHLEIRKIANKQAYLIYMQSTSWETLGWKKHKLESRLLGEISITSDMQMTPPLCQDPSKEISPYVRF